jgi:hypothetical protein
MEKAEFEPRVIRARGRLSQLEVESQVEEERKSAEQELRLVIGQLEGFAQSLNEGLSDADWRTRREAGSPRNGPPIPFVQSAAGCGPVFPWRVTCFVSWVLET